MKHLIPLATFIFLFATAILNAATYDPKIEFNNKCYQTMGKHFYSDGEIDNIKLDRAPVLLRTVNTKATKIEVGGEVYNYSSGIVYTGNDGVQKFNILFVQDAPTLLRTKTVSILIAQENSLLVEMVFTEPQMGNGRSFVRTSFYRCDVP